MKAEEAKKIADNIKEKIIANELKKITNSILAAAENGKYTITVKDISFEVKQKLEHDGYKVTYFGDQRDSVSEYHITWSD